MDLKTRGVFPIFFHFIDTLWGLSSCSIWHPKTLQDPSSNLSSTTQSSKILKNIFIQKDIASLIDELHGNLIKVNFDFKKDRIFPFNLLQKTQPQD